MSAHRYTPAEARAASVRRTAAMTPQQRSERARNAAAARWRKEKGEGWTPPSQDVTLAAFYAEVDARWPGLAPAARTAQAERLRTDYGRSRP